MKTENQSQEKLNCVRFGGGYFGFVSGKNEIALCIDEKYYVLNCDEELWFEVKNKTIQTRDKLELIKFWIEKSKEWEISVWSDSFEELKKESGK